MVGYKFNLAYYIENIGLVSLLSADNHTLRPLSFGVLLMTGMPWIIVFALMIMLREDINPPRFLLNRVPEQITETNV